MIGICAMPSFDGKGIKAILGWLDKLASPSVWFLFIAGSLFWMAAYRIDQSFMGEGWLSLFALVFVFMAVVILWIWDQAKKKD